MHATELHWLPENSEWAAQLADLGARHSCGSTWDELVRLSNFRLSGLQTLQLDRRRSKLGSLPPDSAAVPPVRLAVLASSTVEHLLPAIRVGGLRRSMVIDTYTPHYGQYQQELLDARSGLHQFRPAVVLFALDAHHLLQPITPGMTAGAVLDALVGILDRLEGQWALARRDFGAQIIQNVPLPTIVPVLGNNEHRLPGSRAAALKRFSAMVRERADSAGVDVVSLDDHAATDGLAAWHDPALWHRAKQEIHPQAAPLYGDHVARLTAAAQGRSSKCIVLDLDNTLWGGVIGDDGLGGIKLGQGSARGEAHLAFQRYIRDLSARGVILAVCSKNDEGNALEPFLNHPEMLLKRDDIACFVANWSDKASNIRSIAASLNIGLDSLVFVDDNPAERAVVRRELPMVRVPELPDDPTSFAACIAAAGYFEALTVTAEDAQRTASYRANAARAISSAQATDMDGYLRSLNMRAVWDRFEPNALPRIVQLVNKTNQFNLTTRRMTDGEAMSVMRDSRALTLQIRLIDQFGDNGVIAIVIGGPGQESRTIHLDTWLMSCRVLGRGVEDATLNLVIAEASRLGATRLTGEYRPSPKNAMVKDHYERLGFGCIEHDADGRSWWALDLAEFEPRLNFITCEQARATTATLVSA